MPAPQAEACPGLPGIGEPPYLLEAVVRQRLAPVGEHAASPDRRQLRRIAHADEPPRTALHQSDEGIQVVGLEGHGGGVYRLPIGLPASMRTESPLARLAWAPLNALQLAYTFGWSAFWIAV